MPLLDYLKSLREADAREAFARRCGASLGYLWLVAYGHKKRPSEALCLRIEAESGGVVKADQLRPDVDWSFMQRLPASRAA